MTNEPGFEPGSFLTSPPAFTEVKKDRGSFESQG